MPRSQTYLARKVAGLCVRCAAGLQEDDGVHCLECVEQIKAYRAASPAARAALRKAAMRWRRKNRETLRPLWKADSRERYEANRADGLCVGCSGEPSPGRVRCARCAAMHLARCRRYRARRAA